MEANCLTNADCLTLIVSLVLSRLDYGNATQAGIPANQHCRLQSAAQLIHRRRCYDHVTPPLRDLHCRPLSRGLGHLAAGLQSLRLASRPKPRLRGLAAMSAN